MAHQSLCYICPFCATELAGPVSSASQSDAPSSFSKLILQTETGLAWESDCEDDLNNCNESHKRKKQQSMNVFESQKFANNSPDEIIDSQKKLFMKERMYIHVQHRNSNSSHCAGDESNSNNMSQLAEDEVAHPKYPKYIVGYNIFGSAYSNTVKY